MARIYRIEQWLDGECKLGPWEIEEVGDVLEKVPSPHAMPYWNGHTILGPTWAVVTGLDFSQNALIEARRFADKLGIENSRFVHSSVSNAVSALKEEKFDILYTGRGALCWLPDLDEWANVCSKLVKQNGILYLEESSPFVGTLEPMETTEGVFFVPKYDQFQEGPISEIGEGTYADPNWPGERVAHCWEYRYDTIINALIKHGFG